MARKKRKKAAAPNRWRLTEKGKESALPGLLGNEPPPGFAHRDRHRRAGILEQLIGGDGPALTDVPVESPQGDGDPMFESTRDLHPWGNEPTFDQLLGPAGKLAQEVVTSENAAWKHDPMVMQAQAMLDAADAGVLPPRAHGRWIDSGGYERALAALKNAQRDAEEAVEINEAKVAEIRRTMGEAMRFMAADLAFVRDERLVLGKRPEWQDALERAGFPDA